MVSDKIAQLRSLFLLLAKEPKLFKVDVGWKFHKLLYVSDFYLFSFLAKECISDCHKA